MTVEYAGTSLPKKLGVEPESMLAVIDDPGNALGLISPLPDGVRIKTSARGRADTVVFFTKQRRVLERRIESLARMVFPDGGIWVCWPKRAANVPTDLTEDVVREVVFPLGLVDVKVAEIDEIWSGLRVVHRRENR